MNGAQLLADELRRREVRFVATLCGHVLSPFYAALEQAGLRLVDTRNEQAAAYIAEAYGRLSRRVGVCAVTSGVAHANALTGVVNAHMDGAPISSSVEVALFELEAWVTFRISTKWRSRHRFANGPGRSKYQSVSPR